MVKKTFLALLFLWLFCAFSASAESIRMKVGETKTLSPSVLQTKVLAGQPSWTSSRPNDVKVVSTTMYTCEIEAVNSFTGFATIHCLYYYRELDPTTGQYIYQRSGYVDYHVFVEETEVKSIDIYPTNIELKYGETRRMEVVIMPSNANQDVTWTSSNKSVAFVNSQNVLGANGYGKAIVTATTINGLYASCSVTVKKNEDNSDDNSSTNDNQYNTNYNELDYYYKISKRRMNALREKTKKYKK